MGFSELSEGPAGEEGRKTSSANFFFFNYAEDVCVTLRIWIVYYCVSADNCSGNYR